MARTKFISNVDIRSVFVCLRRQWPSVAKIDESSMRDYRRCRSLPTAAAWKPELDGDSLVRNCRYTLWPAQHLPTEHKNLIHLPNTRYRKHGSWTIYRGQFVAENSSQNMILMLQEICNGGQFVSISATFFSSLPLPFQQYPFHHPRFH